MSAERHMTRIVRSWLRTDEHESADRVLDDVLALLDATPQRRLVWPTRRFADMNNFAKLAIAAAAVVVLAVAAINFLPRGGVGGSGASPSPSPSAKPSPTTAAVFPPSGALTIGRHSMTRNGVPLSFNVATAGWVSNSDWGIDSPVGVGPEGAGFIFWIQTPVGVFADPCANRKGPPLASSAADLAAAVAKVPGTDLVSGPSDVTVGGRPAKQVVITIREDIGCAPSSFYLWYAPQEDLARYATQVGSTIRTWIVDVDGKLVWFDGETYKGAGPKPAQQLQDIVDSIKFE